MSGTPPAEGRFRKGQSGNPKGRPCKQPPTPASAFDIVIDRRLTVIQAGKARELTVDEALQHKTYLEAIAGSRAARRQILKMIAVREKAITKRAPDRPVIKVVIEPDDPRNADEALVILGIASRDTRENRWAPKDDKSLLLEPWAVKAALARRAARRLGKRDLDTAQRCTREAETLAWPAPVEP